MWTIQSSSGGFTHSSTTPQRAALLLEGDEEVNSSTKSPLWERFVCELWINFEPVMLVSLIRKIIWSNKLIETVHACEHKFFYLAILRLPASPPIVYLLKVFFFLFLFSTLALLAFLFLPVVADVVGFTGLDSLIFSFAWQGSVSLCFVMRCDEEFYFPVRFPPVELVGSHPSLKSSSSPCILVMGVYHRAHLDFHAESEIRI